MLKISHARVFPKIIKHVTCACNRPKANNRVASVHRWHSACLGCKRNSHARRITAQCAASCLVSVTTPFKAFAVGRCGLCQPLLDINDATDKGFAAMYHFRSFELRCLLASRLCANTPTASSSKDTHTERIRKSFHDVVLSYVCSWVLQDDIATLRIISAVVIS